MERNVNRPTEDKSTTGLGNEKKSERILHFCLVSPSVSLFSDRLLLCNSNRPEFAVDHTGLEFIDTPAPASWVLSLKACITTPVWKRKGSNKKQVFSTLPTLTKLSFFILNPRLAKCLSHSRLTQWVYVTNDIFFPCSFVTVMVALCFVGTGVNLGSVPLNPRPPLIVCHLCSPSIVL